MTHPARLEVLGRLFGLDPAPAAGCTVLELGCGDATNSLAIAQTLPGARVIALDGAREPLERGRRLAAEAQIDNVTLIEGDIADLDALRALGRVDYVIAHGVYSWIPPKARGALLEACRHCLAPHGIAYVSYNAYPGSYLRDMTRDILAFHLQGVQDPVQRLSEAKRLMEAMVALEPSTPPARALREQLQRMLVSGPALLYHDELATISTPFYFHEFMEHAAAHGLAFLSEAALGDSQLRNVPAAAAELVRELSGSVIEHEQYLDFFTNRMFRRTLLVHAEARVSRAIDPSILEQLFLFSPARPAGDGRFELAGGGRLGTSDALTQAAFTELSRAWPRALDFSTLLERAAAAAVTRPGGPEIQNVQRGLMEAYVAGFIDLTGCRLPIAGGVDRRPLASPLARAQRLTGRQIVSTLLCDDYALATELERQMLPLLDGSRGTEELAGALGAGVEPVQEALGRFAREGLLWSSEHR